jgi:riboflavin synthase
MFTGIIEEMGVVKGVVKGLQGTSVTILAKTVLDDLQVGDSIAISGACMTVVERQQDGFRVDVSPETIKLTTLSLLKAGDPINLERAVRVNARLSGHLVTGHVDAIGTIRDRVPDANAVHLWIEAPREVLRYCVPKGSVTVDGVSLTINEVTGQGFRITIIPHTAQVTTLGLTRPGHTVNLEPDLIGKYVERLLNDRRESISPEVRIDRDYLTRRGLV